MHMFPDSKIHGANMGPIWGRQDAGGSHVGPMNLAIRVISYHLKLACMLLCCTEYVQIRRWPLFLNQYTIIRGSDCKIRNKFLLVNILHFVLIIYYGIFRKIVNIYVSHNFKISASCGPYIIVLAMEYACYQFNYVCILYHKQMKEMINNSLREISCVSFLINISVVDDYSASICNGSKDHSRFFAFVFFQQQETKSNLQK